MQGLEQRSTGSVINIGISGKLKTGIPISETFSRLTDKITTKAVAVKDGLILTAKQQIEKMKSMASNVKFDEQNKEIAEKIYLKIEECQRLLEDLETQFRNEISSNGYDDYFLEQCNSSIDNLIGSIKSATLFMSN